jgi:HK97 gp10 family phage protein
MSGIQIEGFEELEELLQDMTIDESDEKKAIRKAIDVIGDEVEKNTPVGATEKLKKIKKSVKKEGFATVGTVKMGAFYDIFQEFGTSQQKKHIGFFERSVEKSKDEAIEILGKELLDKAK